MSLQTSIDAIAKAVARADATDLPGLVELQEQLAHLALEASAEHLTPVAETSRRAADLVERLVLRDIEDSEAALRTLSAAMAFVQAAHEGSEGRGSGSPLRSPFEFAAEGPAPRRETTLIPAWTDHTELVRHALAPAMDMLRFGHDTAEVRADITEHLRALAEDSIAVGLPIAAELCDAVADAAAAGADEHELAERLQDCLVWLNAASTALRLHPEAALESIRGDLPEGPDGAVEDSTPAVPGPTESNSVAQDPAPPPAAMRGAARDLLAAALKARPAIPGRPRRAALPPSIAIPPAPDDEEAVAIPPVADAQMLGEFLTEAREHLERAERTALELEKTPGDREGINALFRAFHTVKGVAGFLGIVPIVELAHAAESLLDRIRSGSLSIRAPVLDLLLAARDILGQLLEQLSGGAAPTRGAVRELIVRLGRETDGATAPAAPSSTTTSPGASAARAGAAALSGMRRSEQTVKVTTSRLDHLLDLMGELAITQVMVVQDPAIASITEPRVQRTLRQMTKIVRDLHGVAMCLRMVTLTSTFQRMSRLVRDICSRCGKDIELRLEGEETELDRTVVDQIADALVHMVRNACDHGIEAPAERRAAGKPDRGILTLRAFHRGGRIVLEIEDDGRGLHRDRILRACQERRLVPSGVDLANASDDEVFALIFQPGLSTAQSVTDISGRGVGMDVVRRNIEHLGGTIDIRSTPGRGSTFVLTLPLTMAVIDGMVVRTGAHRHVIPTTAIECPFRADPRDIQGVGIGNGEIVRFRGAALPIHRLHRLLGLPESLERLEEGLMLVLEISGERCALFVDEIVGQQQVVIKSLGDERWRRRGITGGAILGDGCIALIIDPGNLLPDASPESSRPTAPRPPLP